MSGAAERPAVLSVPFGGMRERLAEAGYRVIRWPTGEGADRALLEVAQEVAAVVTVGPWTLPEGFLDIAARLKLIACIGAGYDAYDPEALRRRGIALVNAGGVNAEDVAELAIGLMIAARRRIVEADAMVRSGDWRGLGLGYRLKGRRLGILGLGAIGRAVALRAEALGMEVGWHGPHPKPVDWPRLSDPVALADWCHVLVLAARPTEVNRGIVGPAVLEALGPEGLLVNVARGALVEEEALIAALRDGRIAGAGLDVFEPEPPDPATWRDVPNCVLHPHGAGATHEALDGGCAMALENLRRHFAGERLLHHLNATTD